MDTSGSATPRRLRWADLAAATSLGAALVHAAAAGTHSADATLVRIFSLTALVQAAVGMALLMAPSRRRLLAAGAVNSTALAAWLVSRTVGLPVVESLAGVDDVGLQDLSAALLAGASVALAAVALARPEATPASARRIAWLPTLAVPLALVGVAAPHAHGTDGHHAHSDAAAHDNGHQHNDDHDHGDTSQDHHDHGDGAASPLAGDPLLAGADTSHATEEELQAAITLVEATRAALGGAFATTAEAEAAGYVWIGDGRRIGSYQHYVHPGLLDDGRTLDPAAVESLVYESTADGPVLVSAMYLLEPGSTMDDVPDVAGDLTVWHDHQNLCWDETGTRLAGVLRDGRCVPGGELRATSPMLHVWLVEHECGPFAGIEGHGADECGTHEH